jgi:hypothetical protein
MKRVKPSAVIAVAVAGIAAWGLITGLGVETVNAGEAVTISIQVSPQTIVLSSLGGTVSVHTDIPLSIVDRESVQMDGMVPYLVKSDARGNLVAKFDLATVKARVSPPSATFTLTGYTLDGDAFTGTDTVVVKD